MQVLLFTISNDVTANRLRRCIVEFKTMEDEELAAITDTILWMWELAGRGMFGSIRSQVFDKRCVAMPCVRTGSASQFISDGG